MVHSWVPRPNQIIDTGQPVDRWLAGLPPQLLDDSRHLLNGVLDQVHPVFPIGLIAPLVEARIERRHLDECRAFAPVFGVDLAAMLVTNVSYDLVVGSIGCSTVALPTADGPVLARNLDWWPTDALARASCAMHYQREGQTTTVVAGWPGGVGVVSGLSVRGGFALCLNAVSGIEAADPSGYPVLFLLRHVLDEAADFADAVRTLSETKVTAPALVTVVGTQNDERVVVERTPNRCAIRRPANPDAALVATNDWRQLHVDPGTPLERSGLLQETTCSRFDALTDQLRHHSRDATVSDEQLLRMLSSADVIQSITAQHVIMRPRRGTLQLFVPRQLVA